MRLKQLEMRLSGLSGFSRPSARFEQYQTPPGLAARLLYHALMLGDIHKRRVCDLGSGTGILAIGASLLGAAEVVGVEMDQAAIEVAEENARRLDATPVFLKADLRDPAAVSMLGTFDTVVMNPPFGAQAAHADRPFIDTAIRIGNVVYGIFNSGSREFVSAYISGKAEIEEVVEGSFTMKRTFSFHRKDALEIPVEIYRIRSYRA